MRRIALISDIHGNPAALRVVLDDIGALGLERIYCLGDLVGYGPDPAGVIDLIRSRAIPTILGNYDEGIATRRGECGCHYASEQARSDGRASYAFTDGALDDADRAWLAALPPEMRLEHDGVRVLLAHGSPRRVNEYLMPDRSDAQLARLADEAGADLVCVGHVHVPYHRALEAEDGRAVHYVSAGSVGKPKDGDPRAGWMELLLGTEGEVLGKAGADEAAGPAGTTDVWVAVIPHRVEYDVEAVAHAMTAAGLPNTLVAALRQG